MNIIQRPTPKHGGTIEPLYLVLHDTEGNFPSDLGWLLDLDARVSVQYLIAPNGDIYHMVQDTQRAWHAGESSWAGLTYMNGYSIGIEISHISAGSAPYPPAQLKALDELIWMLHQKHQFRGTRPIGHREIAPGRKSDPELDLNDYTWAKVQGRLGLQEDDMTADEIRTIVRAIVREEIDTVADPAIIDVAQQKLIAAGILSRPHPSSQAASVGLVTILAARLLDQSGVDLSDYELQLVKK